MTRAPLVITGGRELPHVTRRAPEPPQAPAQRPGCLPSCCGVLHSLDGGHSSDCDFRPQRVFDHLDSDEDTGLSVTAHQMRRSIWWLAWVGREEQRDDQAAVAGELEVRP